MQLIINTNVILFLWSGNTLLHKWKVGEEGKRKLRESRRESGLPSKGRGKGRQKSQSGSGERKRTSKQMRSPSTGWYTHDEQIQAGLKNLREGLNEARTRGLSDTINNKYTDVNKVSTMDAPKPTDKGVPKKC